tara:strand:+ start:2257 stop:2418 length:162 start_codon:yes stop_codon:yes gene_type:complete
MENIGGAALVFSSGWVAVKIFEASVAQGALSGVGLFALFVIVGVFGVAFGKNL